MNEVGLSCVRWLRFALVLAVPGLAGGCAGNDPVEPHPIESRWLLLELYSQTGGSGWTKSENWTTDAPLGTWYGVTTDPRGNVVELDLKRNGLTGEIPWRIQALAYLESLDLRNNSLSGSIPPELGDLRNLVTLQLGSNWLEGVIPPELGELRKLVTLGLENNLLTGPIPRELGALRDLERLSLFSNGLTDSIPRDLGHFPNLRHLWLDDNRLIGPVPADFRNLERIEHLRIDSNPWLSGPLPQELTELSPEGFWWNGTGLCAPADDVFQEWLWAIPDQRGVRGTCQPG